MVRITVRQVAGQYTIDTAACEEWSDNWTPEQEGMTLLATEALCGWGEWGVAETWGTLDGGTYYCFARE